MMNGFVFAHVTAVKCLRCAIAFLRDADWRTALFTP